MYITPISKLNQFIPEIFKSDSFRTIPLNHSNYILKIDFLSDLFHFFYIKYLRLKEVDNQAKVTLNLSSKILKNKYGNNYIHYVQFLIDNEFIELKKNHIGGNRCREYKFRLSCLKKYNIILYQNQNWKLINYYNSIQDKDGDIYSIRLKKFIKSSLRHITIDSNRSKDYLQEEFPDKTSRKYIKNMNSIQDIEDGNVYIKFDKYGRVHTNYTVLKKKIRTEYLLIDGEPVYERDIPNSQPLFFLLLLSENLNDTINKTELRKFKTYIIKGKFYDDLSMLYGIDRNEMKQNFFKYLFGKKYQEFPEFEEMYPSIHRYLFDYKTSLSDYKLLAQKLQRLEGDFIFNSVCMGGLYKDRIEFFTVHDSICVSENNKVILDGIFEEKMSELIKGIEGNISEYFI